MLGACIGCILWLPVVQDVERGGATAGWQAPISAAARDLPQTRPAVVAPAGQAGAAEQVATPSRAQGEGRGNEGSRPLGSPQSLDVPAGAASPSTDAPAVAQDDVVVTARRRSKADPLEAINAQSFKLTQKVDDAVTAPASRLYVRVTPKPVRSGIRHFLNNLREPVVFANFLLQHKIGKAAETFARFAINSTVGVAGVIDVARRCPFDLPWRPNGFADTLGFYGVGSGPFIFLPFAGPTTIRDLAGGFVDRLASPLAIGGVFRSRPYLVTTNVYRLLDRRAEQEDELRAVRESADPYVARRELYFDKRRGRIGRLKGEVPSDEAPRPTSGGKRRCSQGRGASARDGRNRGDWGRAVGGVEAPADPNVSQPPPNQRATP